MSARRIAAPACVVFVGMLAAFLLLVPGSSAAPTSSTAQPLAIQSSTLVQDGQQLVWRLQLALPFAPDELARARQSLCLLIEGAASGQVCISGPARRSTTPRLLYTPSPGKGSAPARELAATVTRSSDSELTASFDPVDVGLAYKSLRWQAVSTLRSPPCSAPAGGGDCSERYPAQPTLLRLHTPVLIGCVPAGPSLVANGSTHRREIALTFDDGPWNDPPTARFLQVLEREHAPATFFEIGRQIAPYDPQGAAERRMLADGDMIGDHTWSHPDVAALSPAAQGEQLLSTATAIKRATGGFTPCLWRPPYGDTSPALVKLARSLGFLTVMWDIDPRDWALPGVGAIYSNVIEHARNGAIVIEHFGGGPRYQTLSALPEEINTLRRRGYQLVTVSQLLGLRLIYR